MYLLPRRILCACAVLLALLFPAVASADQWSLGYWSPFGTPTCPISAIHWGGLTHASQYAALVNADGSLDLSTEEVSSHAAAFVAAAHANNVSALLTVTQSYWTGKKTYLQSAVTSYSSTLITNIMATVNKYGFDGVDIDWEPFVPATNGSAMLTLASGLRTQLGSKILTVAVGATDYAFWATAYSYFDRVNVMTYDLSGTWNPYSWYNAPLYANSTSVWSLDLARTRYLNAGVPAAKLGLGLPFYGWIWQGGVLASDTTKGISAPGQVWLSGSAPTGTQISYSKLYSTVNASNYVWDSVTKVPYSNYVGSTPATTWYLTWDNDISLHYKVQYIINKGLGGWIVWNLSMDYLSASSPTHPLMAAVQQAAAPLILTNPANFPGNADTWLNGESTFQSSASTLNLSPAMVGTAYSATVNAAGATPLTFTLASGTLPAGLTLSSSGVISGTPTTAGSYTVSITVSNYAGSATTTVVLLVQSASS